MNTSSIYISIYLSIINIYICIVRRNVVFKNGRDVM